MAEPINSWPSGRSKLMTAHEAVERFVNDGDTIYSGFNIISFALTNEIIRQGIKGLKAVAGSVTPNVTMMSIDGNVNRIETGYLSGTLRSKPFQEMMRDGRVKWNDYTNMTITLRLMAGGLGMPFICANSFLGTDYLLEETMNHSRSLEEDRKREDGSIAPPYAVIDSPFDGRKALLYPALKPDVAIVHCQRADEEGNVQVWGPQADTKWGLWSSKNVLVTAEEIVPRSVISTEPHFTIVPGFKVSAVIHEPWGSHPSGLNGYYRADREWAGLTGAGMTTWNGAREYLDEWVYGTKDHADYIAKYKDRFGEDLLDNLRVKDTMVPEQPARYGWR
jgi:glutaconate CoA-transferase subunit A